MNIMDLSSLQNVLRTCKEKRKKPRLALFISGRKGLLFYQLQYFFLGSVSVSK